MCNYYYYYVVYWDILSYCLFWDRGSVLPGCFLSSVLHTSLWSVGVRSLAPKSFRDQSKKWQNLLSSQNLNSHLVWVKHCEIRFPGFGNTMLSDQALRRKNMLGDKIPKL